MSATSVLSLASRVAAAPDQLSCELHDETVILGLRTGEYFGLNPVATSIWRLLATERSVHDLREALLSRFPTLDPARCATDLLELLSDLQAHGLLTVRSAGQ